MAKDTPGRPPTLLTGGFLTSDPDRPQTLIILKKNENGGRSWQSIANEINEKENTSYSGSYIRLVARGEIKASPAIRRAFGLESPYPKYKKILPENLDQVEKQLNKYCPGKFTRNE